MYYINKERIIRLIKKLSLSFVAAMLVATTVWAQTNVGKAVIGEKETVVEGFDDTLLATTDLDTLDMKFSIEKVEQDESYYYVTYTYFDLVKKQTNWSWQAQENVRKISKRIKQDLGEYLASEFMQARQDRIAELKEAKTKIGESGKLTEVTKYSGLIGKTLDIAAKIFPGYEPERKIVISQRENTSPVSTKEIAKSDTSPASIDDGDSQKEESITDQESGSEEVDIIQDETIATESNTSNDELTSSDEPNGDFAQGQNDEQEALNQPDDGNSTGDASEQQPADETTDKEDIIGGGAGEVKGASESLYEAGRKRFVDAVNRYLTVEILDLDAIFQSIKNK